MCQYRLFIGLLVVTFLQSAVMDNNANLRSECCFTYFGRKTPIGKIDYYVETREECIKPGVIFVTKKGYRICVDPQLSWVKSTMKAVDDRDL